MKLYIDLIIAIAIKALRYLSARSDNALDDEIVDLVEASLKKKVEVPENETMVK